MKTVTSLILLGACASIALAGGVITWLADPAPVAGIILNRDNVKAGTQVDARLTDGTDPYGFPSDKDREYVDGNPTQTYATDGIQRVVWSVTVGTLGDSGLATLESTSIADRFHVVWHIPAGTPPGAYGITAKVYDEGANGASSLDSVDPSPVTRTAVLNVGEVTYAADPLLGAGQDYSFTASPANPQPGELVTFRIKQYGDLATPPAVPMDHDSLFVGGVFSTTVTDPVRPMNWQAMDGNGVFAGPVDDGISLIHFTNEWTAPTTPGTYYISVTLDDAAMGGQDVDDRPMTKVLPILVGNGTLATTARTQAQAITAAQAFCTAIGQEETAPAATRFPAPAPYEGAGASHYQPRWLITFEGGTEVELVDQTGVITAYRNPAVIENMENPNDPPGTAITESQAIATAASLLGVAGQTTDLGTATATLNQMTEPPTKIGQTWTVIQPRTFTDPPYAAVTYLGQQATVIVQGETGQIIGYGLTFPSAAPLSAAGGVTSTQASTTATALLTAQSITGYTSATPVKMAVRPNTAWDTNGATDPLPGPAKVAWVCDYSTDTALYEIFVDVDSGNVVGGEIATVRGRMKLPWN